MLANPNRLFVAWNLAAALAAGAAGLRAQSQVAPINRARVGNVAYADKYDWGALAATVAPAGPGPVTITVRQPTVELSDVTPFNPFTTAIPVTVTDAFGGAETVVATPESCRAAGPCTLSATFASPHQGPVTLSSGSDGLQEAIDDTVAAGGGLVVVDDQWRGTASAISDATLGPNVLLEVQRAGTWQLYAASSTGGAPSMLWSAQSGQVSVGAALAAKSFEKVEYADQFPGADIGAQINAAGAQCPDRSGESCTIVVSAGAAGQSFAHTIDLNRYNESLECPTGTLLYYTGPGDAVLVAEGAQGPSFTSGHLDGCTFDGSKDNNTNVSGVRQVNTTGFAYRLGFSVQNFTLGGDVGILWQNQPTSYTGAGACTHCADGSQNERTYMGESRSSDNTIEFELQAAPGAGNSFEYSRVLGLHLQIGDGQYGILVDGTGAPQSASLQHSLVDIFSNTWDPNAAATLWAVENGGAVYQNSYAFFSEETNGSAQIPYLVDSNSLLDFSDLTQGYVILSGGGSGIDNGSYYAPRTHVGSFTMAAGTPICFANSGGVCDAGLDEGAAGALDFAEGASNGGFGGIGILSHAKSQTELFVGNGVSVGSTLTDGIGALNATAGYYVNGNQIIAAGGSIDTPSGATLREGGVPVALQGADINSADQVQSTHLGAPLPAAQGGTGVASTAAFPSSGVVATTAELPLTGTTAAIGGSALAAGTCATGTATVGAAAAAMAVAVSPGADPGAGFVWQGWVSGAGVVTVRLCNITAGSLIPTAETYSVRVLQ